ncbi:MAG: GAP family protein [Frankiales bacterium]|nr:GAP family protein [Frankiales bacterium]
MGEVLTLALAVAASPFPIIPAILLLFTERARPTSLAFLAGWSGGILLVSTVFVLIPEVLSGEGTPTWASWARVVLGLVLVVLGARQWLRRDEPAETPAWMRSLETATPRSALRLGLLLSAANPKIVVIAAAAGIAISSGDASGWAEAAEVAVFTLVGSITVAVPVLTYAVLGERVLRPLGVAKDWLTAHHTAVMAVVLVVLGLLVALKGVQGL